MTKRYSIGLASICMIGAVSGTPLMAQEVPTDEAVTTDIIVTAQKREQRLQDVPLSVTAISGDTLLQRNQSSIQDYFTTVPGLSLSVSTNGQATMAVRGVVTGATSNPVVGVVVDDIPFGSSTSLGLGSRLIPDLDPADLERIELLRGPQGTLYGASSLGGLLKFVTTNPSTSGFSGRAQIGASNVRGGEIGYAARGYINVPVSSNLALGASGFTRRDGGYIDNLTTGQSNVDRVNVSGGRISAFWEPSDAISLKLGALYQSTRGHGASEVDTDSQLRQISGDLNQSRIAGTGPFRTEIQLYSAILNADVGFAQFTSLTGYGVGSYEAVIDLTPQFARPATNFFGVNGAGIYEDFLTRKFTQEVRLASKGSNFVDWTAGLFFTNEKSPSRETISAIDPANGQPAGVLIDASFPSTFREYAGFGSLTLNLHDKFNVQFGARYSKNRQIYNETDSGALVDAIVSAKSRDDAFTYNVTAQFKPSSDLMLYGRVASGYRTGGPNPGAVLGFPAQFGPDRTVSYEAGVKGNLFDRILTFDTALFRIDWQDIQLSVSDPASGFIYYVNGSGAKSQGFEASMQLNPSDGLRIEANVAYTDATLTRDLPSGGAVGFDGDRLPFNSKLTGSLSLDQDVQLSDRFVGYFGATATYTGRRLGEFARDADSVRLVYPSFVSVDLRAGLRFDAWDFSLYVDNVADRRGIVGGSPRSQAALASSPYRAIFIRPQTVGISLARKF